MKGIVFVEFLTMVEQTFDANMVDDIIDDSNLESGGAYTSVGTYPHTEMLQMVGALSKRTDTPVPKLVYAFARYLFKRFTVLMPQFFEEPKDAFEFLGTVHDVIHVEVQKLYPDAKLPEFETIQNNDNEMVMIYKSRCPFADLAHGLIEGAIEYYKKDITVAVEDRNTEEFYSRVFTLKRE